MRLAWPAASLRTYLFVIIVLACTPLALLLAAHVVAESRGRERQAANVLSGSARALASLVDAELRASGDGLEMLVAAGFVTHLVAGTDGAMPPDPRLLRSNWHALFVQDATGSPLPGYPGMVASADAVGSGRRIGALTRWPDGRQFVSVSVEAGGGLRLGAWIPVAFWQGLLGGAAPVDGTATVFDQRLVIVARTPGAEGAAGQPLQVAAAAAVTARRDGASRPAQWDGVASHAAWHRLALADGQAGWGVAVATPAAAHDGAAMGALLGLVALAAGCLLLGVLLARRVARAVAEPLAALASGQRAGAAVASPVHELRQLRDALASADARERSAAQRLQLHAQEFEAVFETSPVAMALCPQPGNGPWRDNQAMRRLLGRAGAERNGSGGHGSGDTGDNGHSDGSGNGSSSGSGISSGSAIGSRDDGSGAQPVMLRDGVAFAADQRPLCVAAREGRAAPRHEQEWRFPAPVGSKWVLVQAQPLFDEQGLPRGAVEAVVDITPLKQAQTRLAQANDQLQRAQQAMLQLEQQARHEAEDAVRAKDELLMMLGHELRNPLNALSAAAEVLKLLDSPDPLAREAGEVVQRQSRQLTRMTNELIDMARATTGRLELRMAPLDLDALADALAADARQAGIDAERRLEVQHSGGSAWMQGDPTRLEQVAGELLRGALRSAAPGAAVWLQVGLVPFEGSAGVVFEIRRQSSGTPSPGAGWGSGPTLALEWSARLVQLHGGTLLWTSDKHTRAVQLRFPAVAAPAPTAPQPARAGAARTVLLVEDNTDAARALRVALEIEGHQVGWAADGAGGLQRLLDERPEVALIDIGLPDYSGYEMARRARATGYAGLMIALSGFDSPQGGREAHRAGFDAYLVKPLDFLRLRRLLETA